MLLVVELQMVAVHSYCLKLYIYVSTCVSSLMRFKFKLLKKYRKLHILFNSRLTCVLLVAVKTVRETASLQLTGHTIHLTAFVNWLSIDQTMFKLTMSDHLLLG